MNLQLTLYLLLCAAALTVLAVSEAHRDEEDKTHFWTEQSLPVLLETNTTLLMSPSFSKQRGDETLGHFCGIECQSALPPLGQTEHETLLGYRTLHENGTCTHTNIILQGFTESPVKVNTQEGHARRKRNVYGEDGRFVISDSHFITNYPFSTAVRLSTGCSGVLVSPKHVLTAADCIHNGRDYLDGSKKLKVGVLQIKTKRRKIGRKRRGKAAGKDLGFVDQSEIIGADKSKARKSRRQQENGNRSRRIRRSASTRKQPVFRWTRVKESRLPQGWIFKASNNLSSDYNYALLELKRPVKQKYMELGVAPGDASMGRIHFSSFDADKSHLDGRGEEKVVYRFCGVSKESSDLIYQHCDAQTGAMGAGVYVHLRDEGGKWKRRVIGVYSGHQWVKMGNGAEKEYNVAVRITPTKYAQICHWIHGDPKVCTKI